MGNCNCPIVLKSTSVAVVGGNLEVTVPTTVLASPQCLKIIICQTIPVAGLGLPVVINDAGNIPAFTNLGDTLRGYQLKCRKCYPAYYSADPAHIQFLSVKGCCNSNSEVAVVPTP